MIRLVVALLALAGSVTAQDATTTETDAPKPGTLIACVPENPNFPFYRGATDTATEFPGLYLELIERIAEYSAIGIDMRRAPWARCMNELRAGQVNMVFTASYLPEREALGCYPMRATGRPDRDRMLISHPYYLYVRKADADRIQIEDGQIKGLTTPVAVRAGQSIAMVLAGRGVDYSESRSNSIVFRQLQSARVDAAAMIGNIGDAIIMDMPDLMRLEPALVTRDYYLIMNHASCLADGAAEPIWAALVAIRDSVWFEQRLQQYRQQARWFNQDRDHTEG